MAQITPRFLDISEAAEYLSTSVRHVRRLVYERRITVTKIGGKVRFRPTDLDRFADENTIEAQKPKAS